MEGLVHALGMMSPPRSPPLPVPLTPHLHTSPPPPIYPLRWVDHNNLDAVSMQSMKVVAAGEGGRGELGQQWTGPPSFVLARACSP